VGGRRVSPDNLKAFETAHGAGLRGAFAAALAPDRGLRPERAGDFADVLRDAAGMKAEAGTATTGAARLSAVVPTRAKPDAADLDLRFDRPPDLMGDGDDVSLRLDPIALEDPAPDRRWPIVPIFLLSGVLVASAVGFFLRTATPAGSNEAAPAVEETTVDLPSAPSTNPPAPKPEQPAAKPAPVAGKAPPAPAEKAARGSLLIRSSPADADVLVNGRPSGRTPVAVRELALGSYTIRVTREGYASEEQTLELTRGGRPLGRCSTCVRRGPVARPAARAASWCSRALQARACSSTIASWARRRSACRMCLPDPRGCASNWMATSRG
jgi:hypothetical protein